MVSYQPTRRSGTGVKVRRTVSALGLRRGLCLLLELVREVNIVEESPWIVELVVPCALQIAHGLEHALQLLVPHQCQERRVNALGWVGVRSVSFGGASQDAFGFAAS